MDCDSKAETLEAPSTQPPPKRMSYEEFLKWADEDTWAEWVNGEVIMLIPANVEHQRVGDFLIALLSFFVDTLQLGEVIPAPFQTKTAPDLPGREPDILFISKEHLDRLKENHIDGPADLVVEIISRDSRARDRGEKFYEYEQGGVREYWLIDPERKQAEFYFRGEDGIYRPISVGDDGMFQSVVLDGLWLKVEWLWQRPRPPLISVLKEWGLV